VIAITVRSVAPGELSGHPRRRRREAGDRRRGRL